MFGFFISENTRNTNRSSLSIVVIIFFKELNEGLLFYFNPGLKESPRGIRPCSDADRVHQHHLGKYRPPKPSKIRGMSQFAVNAPSHKFVFFLLLLSDLMMKVGSRSNHSQCANGLPSNADKESEVGDQSPSFDRWDEHPFYKVFEPTCCNRYNNCIRYKIQLSKG